MTKLQIWIDGIAAAVGAALGFLFGEASGLFLALLAFMALDYISGVLVAIGNKKLSSKVGAKGIAKKLLVLIFTAIGHITDTYLLSGVPAAMSAVMLFYIANEGISIVENAAELGLPVPGKIKQVLAQIRKKGEEKSDEDKGY